MDNILKNLVNQISQNNNDSTIGANPKSIKLLPLQFKSNSGNGFFDAFTNGISSLKPPPFQVNSSPIQMKEEEDYGFPTGLLDFDQIDSISNQNDYFPENFVSNGTDNSLPTGLLDFDQIDSISNQNDYFPESNENKKYFSGTAEGMRIGGFSDMSEDDSKLKKEMINNLFSLKNTVAPNPFFMYENLDMFNGSYKNEKNDYGALKIGYSDNKKIGTWEEDGSKKEGFKPFDLGLLKNELNLSKILGLDEKYKLKSESEILTSNAGIVLDRKAGSLSAGFGTNLAMDAVTSAIEDKDRMDDESERFGVGLGLGPSGAARLHASDADGDGHKEYGFGFDFGPFTYDFKSEDPVESIIKKGMPFGEMIPNELFKDGKRNLTEELGVDKAIDRGIEFADENWTLDPDKIDWDRTLSPSKWL